MKLNCLETGTAEMLFFTSKQGKRENFGVKRKFKGVIVLKRLKLDAFMTK